MASPDYLLHLVGWAGPVLAGQWLAFGPLLWANARPIAVATFATAAWLSAGDALAIRAGIWSFGPTHLLGVALLGVPLEEILFFVLTSLLVTQSLVLFLPRRLKRVPPGRSGWRFDGLPFA